MRVNLLLSFILLIAASLRLLGLGSYPAGFTPDEASFGYDAYSILKTGKDQWGENFPLAFRSFGDFKAPLYTYLAVPSVAVFGLSEFAVRLPNAILGTLAVLVVYFLVNELFSRSKNQSLALVAAFLLAISPWHISLSRGAFEANLTTFLMPLGILAFLWGLRNSRWMVFAAIVFGLNIFSYHSARIVTPLIILTLILLKLPHFTPLHKNVTKYLWALLSFILFFAIAGYTLVLGGGARASDIAIFNPTGGWGAVADRRYETIQQGLSPPLARIFSNKVTYVTSEFIKNYLSYFSPTFLFTQGAGESTYGMIPGLGLLYLFELPFIVAVFWFFIKKPSREIGFILVWILLSPIPAALTKGPGFAANRVAIMMPAIQIFSAYGGMALWEWYKKFKIPVKDEARLWRQNPKSKILLPIVYGIFGVMGIFFFLEAYFYHGPIVNAPSMSYGWKEAIDFLQKTEGNYKEIIISRAFSEPHIFVAFYKKWNPVDYQQQTKDWHRYKKQNLLFLDQLGEWNLGKYTFRDINYRQDQELSSVLLVGRQRDFPETTDVMKKVNFPDGKPAILIIESNK